MSKISRFRVKTNGFLKGNHFNLGIFDFKGSVVGNTSPVPFVNKIADTGRGMTLTQVMSTFCSSMTLPSISTPPELITLQEGKPKISIAGSKIFEAWSVEFFGDEALFLRSMFVKWHQLVVSDHNHVQGLPSQYKSHSAFACLLSPSDVPVHCYSFKGLWPSEISNMSADSESGGIMKFSVTFSYDYFKMNDIEGFGLAMAHEVNEAFQTGGGLFGGGLKAGLNVLGDKVINAPMGTTVRLPF